MELPKEKCPEEREELSKQLNKSWQSSRPALCHSTEVVAPLLFGASRTGPCSTPGLWEVLNLNSKNSLPLTFYWAHHLTNTPVRKQIQAAYMHRTTATEQNSNSPSLLPLRKPINYHRTRYRVLPQNRCTEHKPADKVLTSSVLKSQITVAGGEDCRRASVSAPLKQDCLLPALISL